MSALRFKGMSTEEAVERRLRLLEAKAGTPLPHIRHHSMVPDAALGSTIENFTGGSQMQLAFTGPLNVDGMECFIPLATHEEGLVSGVERGCKVLNLCGGVKTCITSRGMTRSVVFHCRDIMHAVEFMAWLNKNYDEIRRRVKGDSRFIWLASLTPRMVGRWVYVTFKCYTGDAMGMNMVTAGSDAAGRWIAAETKAALVAVSGNMCVDKKPAALNLVKGRGRSVIAECVLQTQVAQDVFHQSPENLQQVNYCKQVGSIASGTLGANAHHANTVAAMYAATGQDSAQVVSGSIGITLIEPKDIGLWSATVTMPCLEVGTVGGGTERETSREVLRVMGLEGGAKVPGANADRLAQVIAAATLAGELSLLAELCRL